MSTKRFAFIILAAGLLLATGVARPLAQGTGGTTIPYPGRLTDDAGLPVADGAYDLQFALYAAATGGEPLWTETQPGVVVRDGAFAVVLGSVTPLPKAALEGAHWLAVGIRGPAEGMFTPLSPRQSLSAVSSGAESTSLCVHDHFGETWSGTSTSTGAGLIVNNSGSGDGVRAHTSSTSDNFAGVWGTSSGTGLGVYGGSTGNGNGVKGESRGSGAGVYGLSASGRGVFGVGVDGVVGQSSLDWKSGVWGYNSDASLGIGVTGTSDNYFGVFAVGDDTESDDMDGDLLLAGSHGEILAQGDLFLYSMSDMHMDLDENNNEGCCAFKVLSGSQYIDFEVDECKGLTVAAGSQASAVKTADHGQRLLYAIEGTEVWLEDIGTAALGKDGQVTIAFDPVYAETANLKQEYEVFVTAQSDQPVLLYVTAKTAAGFTVRGVTLDGRAAACSFDYRVVALRSGYEGRRLEQWQDREEP